MKTIVKSKMCLVFGVIAFLVSFTGVIGLFYILYTPELHHSSNLFLIVLMDCLVIFFAFFLAQLLIDKAEELKWDAVDEDTALLDLHHKLHLAEQNKAYLLDQVKELQRELYAIKNNLN